jgi:hypothetical protein
VTPVLWIVFALVTAGFLAVHALDRRRINPKLRRLWSLVFGLISGNGVRHP